MEPVLTIQLEEPHHHTSVHLVSHLAAKVLSTSVGQEPGDQVLGAMAVDEAAAIVAPAPKITNTHLMGLEMLHPILNIQLERVARGHLTDAMVTITVLDVMGVAEAGEVLDVIAAPLHSPGQAQEVSTSLHFSSH